MAKNGAAKKEDTKEVATQNTGMSLVEQQAAETATNQEVVASDVLIPRLLLMQGISPLVTSRKASLGDMVRSTTGEKVGDPEHPVEIVPIRMTNSWINFEVVGNKPEFRGMEERNTSNEQLPWEYEGDTPNKWTRRKAITLYALLPADVEKYEKEIERAIEAGEAPDLNRTVLPVVLTFQSTSFKWAGKKCASFFNNVRVNAARMKGKMDIAPFQYMLPLTCREEKNNKGSFYVFDMNPPKALKDQKVRDEAARWSTILNTTRVRTDDTGEVMDAGDGSGGGAAEMEV